MESQKVYLIFIYSVTHPLLVSLSATFALQLLVTLLLTFYFHYLLLQTPEELNFKCCYQAKYFMNLLVYHYSLFLLRRVQYPVPSCYSKNIYQGYISCSKPSNYLKRPSRVILALQQENFFTYRMSKSDLVIFLSSAYNIQLLLEIKVGKTIQLRSTSLSEGLHLQKQRRSSNFLSERRKTLLKTKSKFDMV